jgi:hypothetical protein
MPGSFISASSLTSTAGAGAGHATTAIASTSRVAGSPSSATSPVSNSGSSSKSGSSSNTAAIAGGVAGGVVALAIIGALLIYFLRKKTPPQAPSAAFVVDPPMSAQPPMSQMGQVASPPLPSDDGSTYAPGTPVSPMKLYVRFSFSFLESLSMCTYIYTFFSEPKRSFHIPRIPECADHRSSCPCRTIRTRVRCKLKRKHAGREYDEYARWEHAEWGKRARWEQSRQHADRAPGERLPRLAYRLIVVTLTVGREGPLFHILPAA